MKKFTSDFSIKGIYGSQVATADTITELIAIMKDRGYEIHNINLIKLKEWESTSKDGDKCHGNCFTIRNGKNKMTDYTSF